MRFLSLGTMADMSGTSRAAGFVVLTSVAAMLEILRHGWNEMRADDEQEAAEAA